MERMGAVHDAGPAGGAAGEFDRGFDTFRAGIRKKDLVQIRHVFQQPLGQHAGQRRNVELHQVGQVAIEHALQRLRSAGWFRPIAKTPNPLSRVEIAGAVAIEQVLALTLLKADIIADRLEDP